MISVDIVGNTFKSLSESLVSRWACGTSSKGFIVRLLAAGLPDDWGLKVETLGHDCQLVLMRSTIYSLYESSTDSLNLIYFGIDHIHPVTGGVVGWDTRARLSTLFQTWWGGDDRFGTLLSNLLSFWTLLYRFFSSSSDSAEEWIIFNLKHYILEIKWRCYQYGTEERTPNDEQGKLMLSFASKCSFLTIKTCHRIFTLSYSLSKD